MESSSPPVSRERTSPSGSQKDRAGEPRVPTTPSTAMSAPENEARPESAVHRFWSSADETKPSTGLKWASSVPVFSQVVSMAIDQEPGSRV